MSRDLPSLKFGTTWAEIECLSEVDVRLTVKGYAPILYVRHLKTGLDYLMYISAKSLAEKVEPLRVANGNRFTGLRLRVKKESADKMARYLVEEIPT